MPIADLYCLPTTIFIPFHPNLSFSRAMKTRHSSPLLLLSGLLLFASCQTLEQFSIDYMEPAEVSFPEELQRVGVVNNTPNSPNPDMPTLRAEHEQAPNIVSHKAERYDGKAMLTTEALAQSLADHNYFELVVICDSALRATDTDPHGRPLTPEEVNSLTDALGVDFLLSVENVQMHSLHQVAYLPEWNVYQGTVDVKVQPTVRIYLPGRQRPMATINACDSIFWEEFGESEAFLQHHLIDGEELVEEASTFAGNIPVQHILPEWKNATRYYFGGGTVNMRDAAVYARESDWPAATALWHDSYEKSKGKSKMRAAFNLAVGYEMQDSIGTALHWAEVAQKLAEELEHPNEHSDLNDVPDYVLSTLYMQELKKRQEALPRLQMQTKRLVNEDF